MIERDYYDAHDPELYVVKNGVRTLREPTDSERKFAEAMDAVGPSTFSWTPKKENK